MIAASIQEQSILKLSEPLASELGLEIVRVRIMGGKRPVLQIMIDREGGAPSDVEDCAVFSRQFSAIMDAEDPISDPYRLEVSTPGIDRPLTRPGDFARWVGHLAKVELAMPVDGRRRFQGVIEKEDEDGITLLLGDDSALVASLHEMTKASLILTDDLLEAAQKVGGLPPQPGDPDFDGFESEDDETDPFNPNPESGA